MRRKVFIIIRILVLAYLGAAVLLFTVQRKLIFPVSHEITRVPSDTPYDIPFEDVLLPVERGFVTNAWFAPAANAKCTILFCHGNGGTLSDWLDVLRMYHIMNFNVLLFDYGGYGKSTGSPSAERLYEDARAAWKYLTETKGIPAKKIILIGHSIGGGVASQLASEIKPAGLVLQSTFTSLTDVCQEKLPMFPVRFLLRDRFETLKKLPRIACPLLVMHSKKDTLIHFKFGIRLFDAANPPKQFVELRGDHNEGMFASGNLYTEAIINFAEAAIP